MGRQQSSNKDLIFQRQLVAVILIIINLIIMFITLNLSLKYVLVAINIIIILLLLFKFFDFSFTKMLVIFIILANFIYAWRIIVLAQQGGLEPNALTVAFYGFTTVQLWNMATIRKKKEETKQEEIKYNEQEDNIYG